MRWASSFFISLSTQSPWFNSVCSRTVQTRDSACQGWKCTRSSITLSNFHSAQNSCRDAISRAKQTFIKWKLAGFHGSSTDKSFWLLVINISNNFKRYAFLNVIRSDGYVANTSTEKVNFFSLLFSTNSGRLCQSSSFSLSSQVSHSFACDYTELGPLSSEIFER